jgi:hypothetical protein
MRSPSVTRVICDNCRLEIVHVYTIYNTNTTNPSTIAYRSMLHCRRVFTANLSSTASHYDSPRVCFNAWHARLPCFQNAGFTPSWSGFSACARSRIPGQLAAGNLSSLGQVRLFTCGIFLACFTTASPRAFSGSNLGRSPSISLQYSSTPTLLLYSSDPKSERTASRIKRDSVSIRSAIPGDVCTAMAVHT